MASRATQLRRAKRAIVGVGYDERDPEVAELAKAVVDAVGCPDLMGARDVADALGVKVPNIRKVVGLPEPETVTSSGPVWLAAPVLELARQRKRKAARSG